VLIYLQLSVCSRISAGRSRVEAITDVWSSLQLEEFKLGRFSGFLSLSSIPKVKIGLANVLQLWGTPTMSHVTASEGGVKPSLLAST
jgi:hypothetical protein